MELKISKGKKVKKPQYKNQYKVVLSYMYGDADGNGEDEIYIDEDNEDTERFIEFLENWLKVDDDDDYDKEHIKDWDYFSEDGDSDEESKGEIFVEYHSDPSREGYPAAFQSYEITFFDANGDEYEVKVKK